MPQVPKQAMPAFLPSVCILFHLFPLIHVFLTRFQAFIEDYLARLEAAKFNPTAPELLEFHPLKPRLRAAYYYYTSKF